MRYFISCNWSALATCITVAITHIARSGPSGSPTNTLVLHLSALDITTKRRPQAVNHPLARTAQDQPLEGDHGDNVGGSVA
jgi:hypothetical protein